MSCVDLPQIVAKQSYLAQSTALGSTTIYTPAAAGLFRISGYFESTGSNGGQLNVFWTDDHRAQAGGAVINTLASGGWGSNGSFQAITIRSAASNPITITTSFSGTGTYDVYVVVEQLW
jgi:hypothetical protein